MDRDMRRRAGASKIADPCYILSDLSERYKNNSLKKTLEEGASFQFFADFIW